MNENWAALATPEDYAAAKASRRHVSRGVPILLFFIITICALGAGTFVDAAFGREITVETLLTRGAAALVLGLPLSLAFSLFTLKRGLGVQLENAVHVRIMEAESNRRDFDNRLNRALEMADDEETALDMVGRATKQLIPDEPVELLIADNSHAHLERVLVSSPDGEPAGCPVESPSQCVAGRRSQIQVFEDSESLDACPMLRNRARGRCAAVCVPVAIMGRTVGVIHATADLSNKPDSTTVSALQTLSDQVGNRLGMLRVMAETRLQASTDGMTGLVNRRSLENRMRLLRMEEKDFAFVMADLDNFKALNDTHGHEVGDRALRVFADTLRGELRGDDPGCRYGGEEFAFLLPGVAVSDAITVVERIRAELSKVTRRGEVPTFTASYGIAHSSEAFDLEDVVRRADRALYTAKESGRDRVCVDADAELSNNGNGNGHGPALTALALTHLG